MTKKAIWIGLAVSACGLALVSRAQADDSLRPVAHRGEEQAHAPARQLPTAANASPLVVLLGSGLVAITIGLAAIRKYVTSPSA
jgi:hypothetical protein